jgi:ketosteroid isomerase-like protein
MTVSREQMDQMVNDHFTYEANDDIEGVLQTFTDDAVHEIVGGPDGPLQGTAALRDFYARLFPDLRGETVEPITRHYGDDFIVDVTLWNGFVADGRPFKLDGMEGRASFRILHVFELRDGLIARETVWYDHDALAKQLRQQASTTS